VDVAAILGKDKGRRVHVGFALESSEGEARARTKLRAKRFDAVVLNSVENLGEGGGRAWWILPDAEPELLPTGSKDKLARAILDRSWPRTFGGAGNLG
jgi:phosphopantothenoylcysteine decarboxylase/phosphopantothenate--cysteine ligase